MKTKNLKNAVGLVAGVVILSAMILIGCSKEDSWEPVEATTTTGSDILDSRDDGTWTFDKVHSNVMWETKYYGDNALLTGRFNSFDIDVYFDEQTPANSTIEAWVQLSTFNTGEPGRDAYGKCGPSYCGVAFDSVGADTAGNAILEPQSATDFAYFKSTSISRAGSGYVAKGTLDFRGVSKEVELKFNYTGQNTYTGTSGDRTYAGLVGEFSFNAISDFGVASTSIEDEIVVRIDCNLRKI
ncbi:MAG: YceI family protein [Flavobacteriales bacterium]|nr:YceI family protein [Flavobacteriales bacterium]